MDFNRNADLIMQGYGQIGQGVGQGLRERNARLAEEKSRASPDFMKRMAEAIQFIHQNPDVDAAQLARHIKGGGSVADLAGIGGQASGNPDDFADMPQQQGGLGLPNPAGNPDQALDNMGQIFSNPEMAAGGGLGGRVPQQPSQVGPQAAMSASPMVQAQGLGQRADGLRIPTPQNEAEYAMLMQASPQFSQYSQNRNSLARERENRASIERVNSQGNQSREDIAGAERGRKEAESKQKGEQFQERMRQKGLDRASREAQVRMRVSAMERNRSVANDPEFISAKKQFEAAASKLKSIEKSRVDFMADNEKADQMHDEMEKQVESAAAEMEKVAAKVSGRAQQSAPAQSRSAEVSGNMNNPAMQKAAPQGAVEWPPGSGSFWVRNPDGSKVKVK